MKLIKWIHNWIYLCFSFFTDKILKDFDECLLTGMILIDLKKEFHTINLEILFFFKKTKNKTKIKPMGFFEGCTVWFHSLYLSERIFF